MNKKERSYFRSFCLTIFVISYYYLNRACKEMMLDTNPVSLS